MANGEMTLVVITGHSGAGKSEAIAAFEDGGYFCVDNLPPRMIDSLGELFRHEGSGVERAAVVSDVRGVGFMWGLEIVDRKGNPSPELASQIVQRAHDDHRLILRSSRYGRGNVVKVRPALIANESELLEIGLRLAAAIGDIEGADRE